MADNTGSKPSTTTDVMKQLVRGWAAGTAGLPGDLEGLARMVVKMGASTGSYIDRNMSDTPALPTSEFYREWLPGSDWETPEGGLAQELGSTLGGVGANTLVKGLTKGLAKSAARGKLTLPAAKGYARGGSVKSTDKEIDRLLAKYPNPRDVRRAPTLERTGSPLREASPELYGFLGGAMGTAPDEFEGSVLDPLSARVKAGANYGFPIGTALNVAPLVPAALKGTVGALTRVANAGSGPLAGSLAAQRGVIKAPGGNWLSGSVEDALKGLKQPVRDDLYLGTLRREEVRGIMAPGVVDSVLAQNEKANALNSFIDKQLTRYVKNDMATERDPIRALAERGVLHVDPETLPGKAGKVTEMTREDFGSPAAGAGVNALARRWENASDDMLLNDSAAAWLRTRHSAKLSEANPWLVKLPPETPVNKMERAASSNLGFNHLMDELRNATNPNSGLPQHLLLDPKSLDRVSVPQAVERVAAINEWRAAQKAEADMARANNAATQTFKEYAENNPKGLKWVELKARNEPEGGWKQEHDVARFDKEQYDHLQDALKYEGDTMGHCVGGYCPDVLEGRSRIYSLRDAKGQPHVTVEVAPTKDLRTAKIDDADPEPQNIPDSFRIIQIKGKGNRKPNDEYLPFVQDFVKSGKWSDVGDLQNTGLEPVSRILTEPQVEYLRKTGVDVPKWGTAEQNRALYQDLVSRFRADGTIKPDTPMPGYATGGTVTAAPAPTWLDTYNSWVNQHKGQFGGQDMNRAWDADPDAVKQKTALDDTYLAALAAYNKANGTNLAPDSAVLGASAQPNTFTPTDHSRDGVFGHAIGAIGDTLKDPSKGLTNLSHDIAKNPLANAALTAAGSYFGLPPALTAALLGANRTGMDGDIKAGLTTGVASYGAGKLLPDLGWGQAAQTAAGNTVSSLLGGNNIGDSIKSAGVSYLGGQAGAEAKDFTGSDFAGKAANSLTQTALKGKDIGSTLDQLATQYASGQLTDLSGMDPKMAAIVVNLARSKKGAAVGIATGALTQAAQRAVGSTKLSDLAVGS